MSRKSVENATFVFKRGVFALSRLCQENIVSSKLVENGVEVLSKRGNFVSIRVTSANSLFLKLLAQTMNYMDSLAGPYNRTLVSRLPPCALSIVFRRRLRVLSIATGCDF